MQLWLTLAGRELALLAILSAIGAGPAALLSKRFDAAGRFAMAPVLGFCAATCVTTTLLQFFATRETYWVLIPVAIASLALAAYRGARGGVRADWRHRVSASDAGAMLLVVLVVAGPITYTLHSRDTTGPAGYYFTDVDNYVAVQDAATTTSLHDARSGWRRIATSGKLPSDLRNFVYGFVANIGSNLDATPVDSSVNRLLGLDATDTFAPFLTVLLLMGALGAFASVRYFTRSKTWMAALTGCLFGGPMFLELWFDSFQAAIIAIGLTVPLATFVHSAVVTRRRTDWIAISLVLGATLTVYPLYMALYIVTAGLVLSWTLADRWRRNLPLRPMIRPLVTAGIAVAALSILFDVVGVTRDLRYYRYVLEGKIPFPRVSFHLPLSVLPGWIAQTREFWNMPALSTSGDKQLVLGALLPLLFSVIVLLGLRRFRPAVVLIVLAAVCAVFAEYSFVSQQSCTYCAERELLPLTPIAATLIGVGLTALIYAAPRVLKIAALLGVAVVVVSVGQRARIELIRFSNGSYFMDSAARSVMSRLPANAGTVEEEGFGQSLFAQAEQPLVYHLIAERTHGHASVILGAATYNSIQYLDFGPPPLEITGPQFDPQYRYVLTRLGNVSTDRRTIAKIRGFALQRRTTALDITPFNGLGLPLGRMDPDGTAWVQTQFPLQFVIAGSSHGAKVWARLTFRASVPTSIPKQPGVRYRSANRNLTVCVPASGSDPIHTVTLRLTANLLPAPPDHELFPPVQPARGLALTSMRAVTRPCTL